MVRSKVFQILLFPFSILYGIVVWVRNVLYEQGILKSVQFNIPVINVGNLSVGGSGKTPHVEYLIRLLRPHLKVATMSRGYKRKSRGFKLIQRQDSAEISGDEPLLYKRKYPDVAVTVSESRALGVPKLMQEAPYTQALLLDDAFQHREIRPYLNILLTTHERPYFKDWILPSGTLRESRTAAKRADLIIVTKCPENLQRSDADRMEQAIAPGDRKVYFTHYKYGLPYFLFNGKIKLDLTKAHHLIMVSGIATPDYMEAYLQQASADLYRLDFKDHHDYTNFDIAQIQKAFQNLEGEKKAIITTEKDAVKLEKHRAYILQNELPLFVLPIQVEFLFDEGPEFNSWIKNKLLAFKV